MVTRRGLAAGVSLGCCALGMAQFTESELKGLRDALYLGNYTLQDLESPRRPFQDGYRLKIVDLLLDKPIEGTAEVMRVHGQASEPMARLLRLTAQELLSDPEASSTRGTAATIPTTVPSAFRPILADLVGALQSATSEVRRALKGLSASEQRTLIEGLPRWAWPDAKLDFVRGPAAPKQQLMTLLGRVELPRIRAAAANLTEAVERAVPRLRQASRTTPFWTQQRFSVGGLPIVLAGTLDDVHRDRDVRLLIDLGGNDTYTGRYGTGVGYAAIRIDLEGQDRYEGPDLNHGAGVLGIGIAVDSGGDDTYRAGSLSLGAGVAGVGVLIDSGGHDHYLGKLLSQGFGQFGVGILRDAGGDDTYRAQLYAQGAAHVAGVGRLIDQGGNDLYRAGGVFLNSPLFADVHYSFAQGFASGDREDTGGQSGGAGLLTDFGGDDAYVGETYCQSASYWFALGSLMDAGGHDTYRAHHYAQSSAMHMTAAVHLDLGGDDVYGQGFGATHAIGHDYGVAILLDRAGNDVYAARDSRPGIGNANGLGIFVDSEGEDRYFGPPAVANAGRGTGSMAVFVDLAGPDRYAEGFADGSVRNAPTWAVGLDVLDPPPVASPAQSPPPAPVPGSRPAPADPELERLYRLATQWGVGTAQSEVREALNQLITIGQPALNWMLQTKLPTATRLEVRAFIAVASAIGPGGRAAVAARIGDPEENAARVALSICVEGTFLEAGPSMVQALQRPGLRRLAARASGALQAREAVGELMAVVAGEDRLAALSAMVSLAQIGDPQSLGTGQGLLTSTDLPLRKAALTLVARFPDSAVPTARLLLEDPDERRARIGVELLGMVGNAEALRLIGQALDSPRPGVRIQALWALDGRVPAELRPRLMALREDANALVRAVARRVDAGR